MKRQLHQIAIERSFRLLCGFAVVLPLAVVVCLIGRLLMDAWPRLNSTFLLSYPSGNPLLAGILSAWVGSVYLIALTMLIALPIGVGTALYLEEYGRKGKLSRVIEMNIANLAGIPTVIYGLLGLEIFVRTCQLGRSLIAGALTLALLVVPVIVTASREALRTVPYRLREAAYGLGATRWKTIWHVVLPGALPGILTGTILSVSRVLGEASPLILVGAATYMAYLPDGLDSDFSALPLQIFNWVSRPQKEFLVNAAAGIIVLLLTLLLLNSVAIILRNRLARRRVYA